MILQVALLGSGIFAEGAEELAGVEVEFYVLFEVAAICRLVVTVGARQRFRPVVDLPSMAGHLMLIGCQVVTALTFKGTLTCRIKSLMLGPGCFEPFDTSEVHANSYN